ncbi:hypothetical protein L1987_35228 [Smallanthus sonchifolius]|uniref:Uncharacterized protein n=1 Tax=Smallanthus sonchifolius TaxID=185202 RepID=A0ACB9HX75_9ASTR|nr:hypothetical protein L1987_35228 [Smallanthus sonchifolius]
MKRKDAGEVNEDFFDFTLSSPALKIRHLYELLPSIGREQGESPLKVGTASQVQMKSGRVHVWQKSKIYFYVMAPQSCQELNDAGEVDIETIPVNEVEVRQKDLLPVFDSYSAVHHVMEFFALVVSFVIH